jgi:hypothetical protein
MGSQRNFRGIRAFERDMRKYALTAVLLGLTVNVAVALAAPPKKSLTVRAQPDPVVFGRTVALTGHLTGANHAGKTVRVQADAFPYEGNFKNVASATTASSGAWAAADKPQVNTRYRAREGSTTSAIVTEKVRIRVSLKLSDRTPAAGHRVRFSGRACPQHDGKRVRIQRRTPTKKWRTVRRTTLKDLAGSTCSRYRKSFRVFRDGTYRAVVVSADLDHANGVSRRRRVDVH